MTQFRKSMFWGLVDFEDGTYVMPNGTAFDASGLALDASAYNGEVADGNMINPRDHIIN